MKYRHLLFNEKEIINPRIIERILNEHEFYWLIDAEFEEAEIEIKNNTIIWHSGTWISGTWEYGIWMNGDFRWGSWINGIFEDGNFIDGYFKSGIVKDGKIYDSVDKGTIYKK